ncbi:MAG: DUF364 domain-containing protein [Chloroflexota bacterium]
MVRFWTILFGRTRVGNCSLGSDMVRCHGDYSYWVVDKHPQALKPDEAAFWRAPEQAVETIAQADVVIITGSALVEGGLNDLLAAAGRARAVVLAGPTASPWPPPFFERGVHVLGGIRILDQPKLLQVVSEGGSGYFFEKEAEKICLVRGSQALEASES